MRLDAIEGTIPELEPRLGLAEDIPPPSAMIIGWKGLEAWNFLKYCRSYVLAHPEDTSNKLVYRNLLSSYARRN